MALPLLALVVAINAVAAWGIFSTRRGALEAARQELELQTIANARSLEALLATLRGDFRFLARSPPMSRFLATRGDPDPMVRRWSRLDVEATLLLFLEANPSVVHVALSGDDEQPLVAGGRRGDIPELLPAERLQPAGDGLIYGVWPLDAAGAEGGHLEAWLDPTSLLAIAAPSSEDRLRLELGEAVPAAADGRLEARVEVSDPLWEPAIRWRLVRSEPASDLLLSVESLAGRLRLNVALNLAVITLTLVLGTLALGQVRRAARLEAEAEQRARVRELERRLAHSERLASVGRLAAGIAHEINNPLEGMTNHLTLLEDDLARGDAEGAGRRAARVREGLERAAGVVRQVLTFSAGDEGARAEVDLGAVVGEAAAFVASSSAYDGVELEVVAPPEPVRVAGNATTLGQLFLNLLLNACEAQGGSGVVEVRIAAGAATASVAVADRGPGFAPEALEHLFEPFFSTRGSTGLGLAVSHGIVRDHGGELRADNRPGGGAVVEVRLPLPGARRGGTAR